MLRRRTFPFIAPRVASAPAPVVPLIALGVVAGRRGWIGAGSSRELSSLVFFLLLPGLPFRADGLDRTRARARRAADGRW